MFPTHKPHILLAIFLVSLAVSLCLAVPVETSSTSLLLLPRADRDPSTPAGAAGGKTTVPAPIKGGGKAPKEITDLVAKWMKTREEMFRGMPSSKGGTEGWCQYQFEMDQKKRMGENAEKDIELREIAVYTKNQFADFTFREDNIQKGLIIELKVESSMIKGSKFAAKVKEDQEKVQGGFKPNYQDYLKGVLAIAWSEETHKELTEINMVPVAGGTIALQTKKLEVKLYVWTGEKAGEVASSSQDPFSDSAAPGGGNHGLFSGQQAGSETPQEPGGQTPGNPIDTPSKTKDKTRKIPGSSLFKNFKKPKKPPGGGAGGASDTVV